MNELTYPYIMDWDRLGRKGQRCEIIGGRMGTTVQVKFQDGFTAIISRGAVRRVKDSEKKSPLDTSQKGSTLAANHPPSKGE